MFLTHRLYLGGPSKYINGRPNIFGDTFVFLLLLLSLTLFFIRRRKLNHPRSINYWTKLFPLPVRFVLCAWELLPTDNLQCLSFVAGRNKIHHPMPRLSHTSATLSQYLAPFRTFWRPFFHNRYILTTNLATFLKEKKLRSLVQLEDVSRARGLILLASVLSRELQRNSTFSWPQPTRPQ